MGSAFSRGLFGSVDGFLGEYEKNFERLSALKDRHAAVLEARTRNVAVANLYLFAFGALGTGLGVAYVLWVHRQPDPGYSEGEKARAGRLLLLWLMGLVSIYYVVSTVGQWAVENAAARLKRAVQEEQKLLVRLKEQTKYDKVQTLIAKQEEQFATARAGTPRRSVGRGGLHTPRPSIPGPPGAAEQGGSLQQMHSAGPGGGTPATGGRALATLQRGLNGAGQHFLPALDRFANTLMGDNPALVEALRAAQSENGALRAQLGLAHEHMCAQEAELAELRGRLGLTPTPLLALPEAPGGSSLRRGSLGASGPLVQEILPSASSLSLGPGGSAGSAGGRVSPGGPGAGAGVGAALRRGSASLSSSGRLLSFAERLEQAVDEQEERRRRSASMEGLGLGLGGFSGEAERGPASHPVAVADAAALGVRLPARQRRRSSSEHQGGGGMRRSMSGPSARLRPDSGGSGGAQDGGGSDEAIEQPE